jgi:hypothetical protein
MARRPWPIPRALAGQAFSGLQAGAARYSPSPASPWHRGCLYLAGKRCPRRAAGEGITRYETSPKANNQREITMSDIEIKDTGVWALALSSKDGVYRQSAREELVAMGRAATPVLVQLLEDAHSQVRWEAALALKEISDPAAVDALVTALRDEEGDVRWVVAEALAGIGRASLIPLVRSLTEHADSFELRDSAPVVIGFLRDPGLREMLEPLHEALRDGGSPEAVIAQAGEALEVLEGRGTSLA